MSRSTRQNSGVPTSRRQMILRPSDRARSGSMRSDATAHADRTALRAVRRLPRTSHLAQPSRGQRRCSGQPYRMQLTLGARRTAGRRQAADLAPGLPAEQVQPPPTKPHRNGPSALQATVPSGRLQARRIGNLLGPAHLSTVTRRGAADRPGGPANQDQTKHQRPQIPPD